MGEVTPGALRRFDAMLARAGHPGTPLAEAQTALEGARAVLRKYPAIPRGSDRIESTYLVVGLRDIGERMAAVSARIDEAFAARARSYDVVRDKSGGYVRRPTP